MPLYNIVLKIASHFFVFFNTILLFFLPAGRSGAFFPFSGVDFFLMLLYNIPIKRNHPRSDTILRFRRTDIHEVRRTLLRRRQTALHLPLRHHVRRRQGFYPLARKHRDPLLSRRGRTGDLRFPEGGGRGRGPVRHQFRTPAHDRIGRPGEILLSDSRHRFLRAEPGSGAIFFTDRR